MGLEQGSVFFSACVFDLTATGDSRSVLEASAETSAEVQEEVKEIVQDNQEFAREYEVTLLS